MPLKLKRYAARGPNWYLRGTIRGKYIFETTGTNDRRAAEAIRIKREAEILDRSIFGPGATVTFEEAAASYLEHGGEARFLGREDPKTGKWTGLIGHFQSVHLSTIGQAEADEAAVKLYPGTSAATRKRQCYGPLMAILNHAADRGWLRVPSIKPPKVKEVPVEWAPPAYVARLLEVCTSDRKDGLPDRRRENLRLYIVSIVYSGARLAEVHRIDWDRDIDLSTRHVTLRKTKNGKMRTVPIHDRWLAELANVPVEERRGPLFHWKTKTGPYKALQTACKRAGLPYLSPHKLGRHTYATWLRRYAKRDLKGLQHDGGWDSINSVARYAHVVPGETEAAIPLLPSVRNPCSDTRTSVKGVEQHGLTTRAKRLGKG